MECAICSLTRRTELFHWKRTLGVGGLHRIIVRPLRTSIFERELQLRSSLGFRERDFVPFSLIIVFNISRTVPPEEYPCREACLSGRIGQLSNRW